ncbi:hypothetical protein AXX17_AT3G03220 [Arabidopsis thaliana]|uniref:Transmembrane protein n=1 Tax=Arabidopsis thaliana TaxID=3702 RepID=A0A178VJ73_ARATH|nr:hypothetical protein AXX17_AT3G03220 [Arabidopsis thaliana]
MSMKFVFVLFLAVTSVQNVEGKRLLPEETSQLSVLDHEASPSVVIPQASFHKQNWLSYVWNKSFG